ncbi:MAG: DUF1549 and DUF1553 domain-containing protein [Gemmataceae bacterium]|nr:DUF1549 and DUF1553 domain-containing protein [Gemmataceae bacterium]
MRLRPCAMVGLMALVAGPALLAAQEPPLRQRIDAELRAAWQREKLTPAPRADDAAFLRRIYLDLAGTIPSYEEAKQFLADTDADRRTKLIDKLLADPRFAAHQAQVWDLVFFGRNPPNGDATRKRDGFRKWLAEQFAKEVSYDRWVRGLLLAEEGDTGLFYVQYRSRIEETTVAVSRIFMGTQLQCARCHDHPYEPVTQRDFYGMAGFFARLTFSENAGGKQRRYTVGEKSTGEVLFSGSAKEQRPGKKGDPVKPKFLGGPPLDEPPLPKDFKEPKAPAKPLFSRKEKFVAWLTAPDNPYFTKAVANRVWAQFMGRGQVHPVDDLSDKNTPTHPELFQAMTRALAEHKRDLKWFIREIVNTDAYQLASTGKDADPLPPYYERARVRPLSAEEMVAALREGTGTNAANRLAGKPAPEGATSEYMARYFGEPTNGRGDFQASLQAHLFMNNSGNIRQMLYQRKGSLSDELAKSKAPWPDKVDRLFLTVLTRLPRPEERERFVAFLTSEPRADQLIQDAIWALVNCAEFRFNH